MLPQASLGLRNDSCRRLWQVWDSAKASLDPLIAQHHLLEQRLDSLLVMHDISNDGSYQAIFHAGKPRKPSPYLLELKISA